MGATNSTLNYHLSQFISTDKPAWLQDYNGDMEKIDVGINNAKVAADTAQNTANSAVSSIGTVTSDITTLQTNVLAHTTDITDLQGDVNTIESLIGNGTPTTTDQTIIGAINELKTDISIPDRNVEKTIGVLSPNNQPIYRKRLSGTLSSYTDATNRRTFELYIPDATRVLKSEGTLAITVGGSTTYVAAGAVSMSPTQTITYTSFSTSDGTRGIFYVQIPVDWALTSIPYDITFDYLK